MGRSGELTIETTRVVAVAPSVVFAALSDPSELARWWGPRGFTTPSIAFAPRVGATYRIEMRPPDADSFFLTGEFREVDPPTRLAYTFVWEEPDPDDVETLVELSLQGRRASTELSLTQGPFRTRARRDLHRDGWADGLDKLDRLLTDRS